MLLSSSTGCVLLDIAVVQQVCCGLSTLVVCVSIVKLTKNINSLLTLSFLIYLHTSTWRNANYLLQCKLQVSTRRLTSTRAILLFLLPVHLDVSKCHHSQYWHVDVTRVQYHLIIGDCREGNLWRGWAELRNKMYSHKNGTKIVVCVCVCACVCDCVCVWTILVCTISRRFYDVRLGLSHERRNTGWGCLTVGCWGRYLGLRGTRWNGSGEDYIMRSFMLCTAHRILFGRSIGEEWDGRGM